MNKSIYKITNLINNKSYIGQSKDPFLRFKQHCCKKESYRSLINDAILKYGKENFSFEILESDIDNYNEREKYWIEYYHTQAPNGYNLTPGGEEPPIWRGEEGVFTTHSREEVERVKWLLKNTDLTSNEIAQQTGYADASAIDRINSGAMWFDNSENYPLRMSFLNPKTLKERWEQVVYYLQNTTLSQKTIAEKCGVKRTAVTAINNGQNGKQWNDGSITYPIRSGRHYNSNL